MFSYSPHLNLAGWLHLCYFGIVLPGLVVLARKRLLPEDKPLPDRLLHFQRTAATILMLTSVSLLVAWAQHLVLFPRQWPAPRALLAGLAMYVAFVFYMRPRWRRAVERKPRAVHLYMPSNANERAWWVIVSVLAGVGEEITWRGVQTMLLVTLTGLYWPAALYCAGTFGLAHIIQGWRSVAVIVVFALGFHTLVWLSGSLYVAMAVHAAYDITAGIAYGQLGRELLREPST